MSLHKKLLFAAKPDTGIKMLDGISVHLLLHESAHACVHLCVCMPVGRRERENILPNPPEQFRRVYLLVHSANTLKWIEEINFICICKFQTVIFFRKQVFIISMHILPQQCKQTSADPQPCINICDTFLCLVNNYLLPCLYQECGNRELWLIKNFKNWEKVRLES